MHYVYKSIRREKKTIGVIRPKIRVKNEISRFLKFLSSSTLHFPFVSFGFDPGFEQWHYAAQSIFQIEKSHSAFGKFMNSTPPVWDLSRESWGARSEPLLMVTCSGRPRSASATVTCSTINDQRSINTARSSQKLKNYFRLVLLRNALRRG